MHPLLPPLGPAGEVHMRAAAVPGQPCLCPLALAGCLVLSLNAMQFLGFGREACICLYPADLGGLFVQSIGGSRGLMLAGQGGGRLAGQNSSVTHLSCDGQGNLAAIDYMVHCARYCRARTQSIHASMHRPPGCGVCFKLGHVS